MTTPPLIISWLVLLAGLGLIPGCGQGSSASNPPSATTNPDYVHFPLGEGAGTLLGSVGSPSAYPNLSINGTTTQLWSVPGKLTLHAAGNYTTRVYGNAVIDTMMRLDDLAGEFKCKFFATRVVRHVATTPVSANERIFQYGDQGSAAGLVGGWVARINAGSTAPFLTKSISFAIHTPDLPGTPKPGGQSDPNFPDPIATTPVLSDAQWEAGVSILVAVDNSVSPYAARIYIDGALVVSDVQSSLTWPLPGVSNNGPGTDADSNGFALFAQSTNQGTSLLKNAEVSDIWIGRARDTAHLNAIAQALHLNIKSSPY